MKIVTLEAEEWDTINSRGVTQQNCEELVSATATHAASLFPTLSKNLNILIRPHLSTIQTDSSVGGETHDSELIVISFNEAIPNGKEVFKKLLTSVTLHEANHAARFAWIAGSDIYEQTLVSAAIWEGLATATERDYSNAQPKWGAYESDEIMSKWLRDLQKASSAGEEWSDWAFKRDDGRDWLAYKVGTWLVDRAAKHAILSIPELTTTSAEEILDFACA